MNPRKPAGIAKRRIKRGTRLFHPLTGLPTAFLVTDRLKQAMIFAKRYGMWLAVLTLELNNFDQLTKEHGARIANKIQFVVANRLADSVFRQDTVAHVDKAKFIVMLTCLFRDDHYSKALQRLTKELMDPIMIGKRQLRLHYNIGIAIYPKQGDSAETLIKYSELALAYAKKSGLDNFKMYRASMSVKNLDLGVLQQEILQALANDEFSLEYQPVYDMQTQSIIAVETLLRWQHPRYGLINPSTFIPLVNYKTEVIIPLSEWVLRTACLQSKLWRGNGLPLINLIVNLPMAYIKTADFAKTMVSILKQARLSPNQLVLEVDENNLAKNPKDLVKRMLELQALGVNITLNDFDIRFSNIDFLMQFPIHKVKIDRSHVENSLKSTEEAQTVCTAITTARQLKMRILAVGVETKEQLDFLKNNQVDEIQGYYFSKPINARSFARLLQDNTMQHNV